MKLVFVGNGLLDTDCYPIPNQGGSVQTWGLARELAKRGHDVSIIRRSSVEGKEIVERVNLISIKFKGTESIIPTHFMSVPFYITRMFSSLYFSKKSKELLQKIRPDIICLLSMFSGILPSSLSTKKLYIMHVPDGLGFFKSHSINANGLNAIMFYVKKGLQNSIMSRVEKVVVLNRYIEEYLRNRGFSNVLRIPNCIDPEAFRNGADENYILYAGRFDWNKNVCSLLSAFAEVHKLHPNYNLYLVGAGPEEGRIKSLVEKRGVQSNVKILPWLPRTKVIDLISKCSIFVLPSFFEAANPVVVLEAMASAKPIIARTNMGTVDIVVHGENGYLYHNEKELREHLELLLSDYKLRKKTGRIARKTIEEEYSFARMADKYEELFSSLL